MDALEIILTAVDNASKPIDAVKKSLEGIDKLGSRLRNVGGQLTGVGTAMAAGVTAPIVGGLTLAANTAINLESAMADVQKAANLDDSALEEMQNTILELTRTIPQSATELAGIAASGGRLGIAQNDLGSFVETVSKLSVAFDMSSEQAGQSIAEIANNFQMLDAATGQLDFGRVETFGNVVNNLADSMATSESNIINFVNRSAGVGQTFGILEKDVAAFAASFTALGIAPEKASNAFNTTAQRLAMATELGGEAAVGFDMLGLSAENMQTAFEQGRGTEAMMQFLDSVQAAGPQAASALNKILGQGFSDEILQAASGGQQFDQAFNLAQQAEAGGGSTVADSFATQVGTTESQIQTMKNSFAEVGNALGPPLIDGITGVLQAITPLAQKFGEFLSNNPMVAQMGTAFLAVAAAIGPVLLIIGQIVTAVGTLGPIFAAIGGVIAAVFGAISAPVLLVIAAIAGLGVAAWAVISNWSAVKSFFTGLWNGLVTAVSNFVAQLGARFSQMTAVARARFQALRYLAAQTIARMVSRVVEGVNQFVARIRNGATRVLGVIRGMGNQVISAIRSIAARAFNAGARIVGRLAAGIRSAIGKVREAAGAIGDAIASALPGSPVKWGPLRVLNNIQSNPGAEIGNMLARGVESSVRQVQDSMSTLGGLAAAGMAVTPQLAAAGIPQGVLNPDGGNRSLTTPANRSPASSNNAFSLNYSPTINIEGEGRGDVERALENEREKFQRLMEDFMNNQRRTNYLG